MPALALVPPLVLAAAAGWSTARGAPPAPAADAALAGTTAALGDLGLALLREMPGTNAVVSPLAVATVLGMVQSGASGVTEDEIEALFGAGRTGAAAMRQSLPALSAQMRAVQGAAGRATSATPSASPAPAGTPAAASAAASAATSASASPAPSPALRLAARAWIDDTVAKAVPPAYTRRLAARHGADAVVLSFADPDTARASINAWTAEHTGGRIGELLPAGSVGKSTQVTLTAAAHFRSPWARPFDAGQTEPRPFTTAAGAQATVPTLHDERAVAQAVVDGRQLYALPFAGGYDLVLALPAADAPKAPGAGDGVEALLKNLSGEGLARWRAALVAGQPVRCSLALPKFAFAPKPGSIKPALEKLGVKRAFTARAELAPMLGRASRGAHVDDVHHAAGIAVDEQGGEAVAAAAATVKPKTLAAPPPCVVDRPFAFVVMHRASGAPLFIGRVGDPTRSE
ncbi:MAG: hypothetical protein KIT17_28375 [Rubrivivax sp.]|nr:hypothetical protein [Rubrivivax sp.]